MYPIVFTKKDALAEFKVVQTEETTEQHAILESIYLKLEVEANRRYIHEADVMLEELFIDEEDALEFCPTANDHEAGGSDKDTIIIFDDK